jgi:polyphosphate glucokinase
MDILGIDIGGSGIKGAIVNVEQGEFVSDRHRIATPSPAKPHPVSEIVTKIVQHFEWDGAVGCAFPAIIKNGVTYSAANIDDDWIGMNASCLIQCKTGVPVTMLNDADAAGIAEMRFGAGRGRGGTVIVLTLGTGIGSAVFLDGSIVPNTELGHVEIRGKAGENRASNRIRKKKDWSWKKWAKHLNEYLQHVEFLFAPDLFIIGGGVSKKYKKYFRYLDVKAEIVPALLRNKAGIIGAALAVHEQNPMA